MQACDAIKRRAHAAGVECISLKLLAKMDLPTFVTINTGELFMRLSITGLILLAISVSSYAVGPPEPMARVEFDVMMQSISNWKRWGSDDELGTLNLITPAKRVAAAALVKDGITVSLALDLNKIKDELNGNPFEHELGVG